MVVLDEGLNRMATVVGSAITLGQWGRGTALPLATDTGLGSAIPDTSISLTTISAGNAAQFTHELSSNAGSGQTFSEFEVRYSNGDSLNRSVGAPFTKTDSFTTTTILTVNFIRN